MDVTFYLPHEPGLDRLRNLDPDTDWREFHVADRMWLLQTYLRLEQSGRPVRIEAELPEQGIVVFSNSQRKKLPELASNLDRLVLVGVRHDTNAAAVADFEVVQNGRFADAKTCFFIPHWPQPGMIPRDPSRGTAVRCLSFKGFDANLHPEFRTDTWSGFLRDRGIVWQFDSVPYARQQTDNTSLAWNDYHDVDVVLAVRPPHRNLYVKKPASKLVNAWRAGVPSLLGPEYAYREARRSELDFIEVADVAAAKAAVVRLQESPDLYRSMVENGLERATDYSVDTMTRRWADLLFNTIPGLADSAPVKRWRRVPLWARNGLRRLQGTG